MYLCPVLAGWDQRSRSEAHLGPWLPVLLSFQTLSKPRCSEAPADSLQGTSFSGGVSAASAAQTRVLGSPGEAQRLGRERPRVRGQVPEDSSGLER